MTKTVTVTLTEKQAREVLAHLDGDSDTCDSVEDVKGLIKDALPPEWEEGTVAWVTRTDFDGDFRWICTYDGERGWLIGGLDKMGSQHRVTKVEPLRVMGKYDVAIPSRGRSADLVRTLASISDRFATTQILNDVADALAALAAEERAR